MVIGERLKQLREAKNFSQGDIEQKTGLLRCYISRVENGHTVPAIETLEKMARAMEVPLYALFMDENAKPPKLGTGSVTAKSSEEGKMVTNLQRHVKNMSKPDRQLLLHFAGLLSRRAA